MSEHGGGTASGASWWPSDVTDAMRERVASIPEAAADLATELTSFTTFQKRVDQLIVDLKGSDAGPDKVGRERLARHQLGGGDEAFAEAADLFSSYQKVITELEHLSKMLSDSIEGMGIAVLASHKGYEQLDVDVRDRMAAIARETDRHYGGDYDPTAKQGEDTGGGDGGGRKQPEQAPSSDESGVTR